MKEISKYQHFLFGLHRIRIAGNNSSTKFDDLVKDSLTKDAFLYETKALISNKRKVESPVPGYPVSDLTAFLLTQYLETITNKKTKEE